MSDLLKLYHFNKNKLLLDPKKKTFGIDNIADLTIFKVISERNEVNLIVSKETQNYYTFGSNDNLVQDLVVLGARLKNFEVEKFRIKPKDTLKATLKDGTSLVLRLTAFGNSYQLYCTVWDEHQVKEEEYFYVDSLRLNFKKAMETNFNLLWEGVEEEQEQSEDMKAYLDALPKPPSKKQKETRLIVLVVIIMIVLMYLVSR